MQGQLFTQYFLTDGIRSTRDWEASAAHPDAFNDFRAGISRRFQDFSRYDNPNEAETEQELIRPLLELLGWADYLPQQGTTHGEDIPDLLLFADADAKARAAARTRANDRFRDALVIAESKRLGRPLDAREPSGRVRAGTPHGQILRYLATADTVSEGRIRWGILTNGGVWRLYDQRARPRASSYFEVDLAHLLTAGGDDDLRTFELLFRRDAFVLQPGAATTFLEDALAEGRRYEQQVAQDLSTVVFQSAFPNLVKALVDAGGADLAQVRQAALVLLYRLLFVLYAEDRGLLPVNDSRYDDYGLRRRVRDDIARRTAQGDAFSAHATSYYDHVITLGKLIDAGDASIGLPPYNGGLFAPTAAPLLEASRLPDAAFAPIVHDLSHTETAGARGFVNYRDMSVQQLGSIYERLLEREPVRDAQGEIDIRPNPYARKDSGSFYTPQELVDLIVDQTLKPLTEERLQAFEDKARELASDRRPKHQRRDELRRLDPAEAVLELKVLDPAMGSGHFLVTAVDFLADYIADLVEYVPAVPEWLDGDDAYESPLVERVAAIRHDILQRAREANWVLDEAQLSDQTIIRRMVLKRCIYGVDKNPLTVELAKVSLWLHSFTVGAPLSFLDHHLRCGDSLLGLRVLEATGELNRLGGLFASTAIAGAENATDGMHLIEAMSDADVAEVRQSAALFQDVEATTADLRGLLDFLCGLRWLTAGMRQRERSAFEAPLVEALGRQPDNAYKLLARGPANRSATPDALQPHSEAPRGAAEESTRAPFEETWHDAASIAQREGFLHWEVAFPGVWRRWESLRPEGGFDAVIGNPPWDRIKLQEVEWFATRDPAIARAPTAAARKAAIKQLRDQPSDPAPSPSTSAPSPSKGVQTGDMVDTSRDAVEDGDVPFAERRVSDLRAEFVALARQPGANRRALCRRFEIAPTTGYKWLGRYAAAGAAGLEDRSRRPHRSPARTTSALEQVVLALRAQHPTWGARKLRVLLARQGVQPLPAASTITAILRRHGALDPAQGAGQPRAFQRFEHPHPNALWQMDFKAGWSCGAGRCHPLTILDDHSRYALGLAACANQRTATVRAHLVAAFQRYGLPDRLLVDNGSPWGNHPAHPYTPLTVWLRRLGIAVSHSRPYHPQTLGKDERFHGTLERDLGRQPPRPDLGAWQTAFDAWRHEYNHVRPHESLALAVPATRYHVSPRPFPAQLPPLPYGPDDHVRRVQAGGWVSFQGHAFRLPKALRGQPVALRPTATDGCWAIRFLTDDLGTLDLRNLA